MKKFQEIFLISFVVCTGFLSRLVSFFILRVIMFKCLYSDAELVHINSRSIRLYHFPFL